MIKINVKDKLINIKGHANYDEFGKDIVCASVSATVLCTINGIISIDEDSIYVEQIDSNMTINITKDNEIVNKLITNMIECLKEIEKDYPDNIKITK